MFFEKNNNKNITANAKKVSFTAVVATSGIISSEELPPWLGRGNKHRSNERRRPVTSPAAAKSSEAPRCRGRHQFLPVDGWNPCR